MTYRMAQKLSPECPCNWQVSCYAVQAKTLNLLRSLVHCRRCDWLPLAERCKLFIVFGVGLSMAVAMLVIGRWLFGREEL